MVELKRIEAATADVDMICRELLEGAGAVVLTGMFDPGEIAEARRIVMAESERAVAKVTHFQGEAEQEGRLELQRRVWNLLIKGDVFAGLATHPDLMRLLNGFLGTEFIMGSIAANRILPDGPGQEPHIDYPYWDFHRQETHPTGLNASFPLNAQATILLDEFSEESGATAFVPGSQKLLRYPAMEDGFHDKCQRMLGEPGDLVLFFGAVWHCAMPNRANHDRSAILIQYLPKWVKPMEDLCAVLSDDFIRTASPQLKQLLGLNYPYPEVLDEAPAGNAEGRQ